MSFNVLDPADEEIPLRVRLRDGSVKEYRVASPSWEVGVSVNQFMEVGLKAKALGEAIARDPDNVPPDMRLTLDEQAIASGWDNEKAGQQVLGDTFAEMVADGLPLAVIQRAIYTAVTWVLTGSVEDAARVWDQGANPKDTRRKPLDRQPKTSPKSKSGTRKKT